MNSSWLASSQIEAPSSTSTRPTGQVSMTIEANANTNVSTTESNTLLQNDPRQNHIVEFYILPLIFIVGTICNIMTFCVLRRKKMRHQSTYFYMAVLAVTDELQPGALDADRNLAAPLRRSVARRSARIREWEHNLPAVPGDGARPGSGRPLP